MSQPTRRTNGQSSLHTSSPSISTSTPSTTTTASSSSSRSRTQTATAPLILLAIYPAILVTGSLFSLLEPHARAAPYSAQLQSHPPSLAPSYFARKSNILNQYFVKILWIWITGAFGLFLAIHPLTGAPTLVQQLTLSRRRSQAFLRYVLVTGLWILTTQWFFGAPLIDRSFRLTGGRCEMVARGELSDEPGTEFVTAAACKLAGGSWAGGHDISGHVFILILGSAFLTFEAWPILEVVARRGWAVLEEREREEMELKSRDGFAVGKEGEEREWGVSMGVISGIVGTALWMLLMTATYFHTWFEKLTGLVVAFSGLSLIYILPRFVPAVASILGQPGI